MPTATPTKPATGLKALCNREGLLHAAASCAPVVPARSPKPVLLNFRLDIDPDAGATLTATDLELSIRARVLGVTADAAGSVLLPAARTLAILRAMPPETPHKVALAKMRALIRRGLIDGCDCGCRGDFVLTDKGRAALASPPPTP